MQKTFFLLFAILINYSCNRDNINSKNDYKPLVLKKIDVTKLGEGHNSNNDNFQISGYEHYLTVENYNDEAWDNFLVDYADKYIDTCRTDLPIWAVTFCRPFNYEPYGDSRDLDVLEKHAIITIGYGKETLLKKYPDISFVEFWNNGKSTYIQTLTLNRMKDKGYVDSLDNYKTDIIKEMELSNKR